MKKFAIVLMFATAIVGFASAQYSAAAAAAVVDDTTDNSATLNVEGQVSQKLSITLPNLYYNIGELGTVDSVITPTHVAGTPFGIGNVTIRSNIKSWDLTVFSAHGGLYASAQPVEGALQEQLINYTLTIDTPTAFSKTFTSSSQTHTVTVNRKSVGIEPFAMTLNYSSTAETGIAAENWLSAVYSDTLTFTVAAH